MDRRKLSRLPARQPIHLHNEDVVSAFAEMAELLAISGENPFRVRAYERAANVIRGLPRPLADIGARQDFDRLPGIGADLAGKIAELLRTGRLKALDQLRRRCPAGLRELLRLPGLGPVRVRALHAGLGMRGVADLRRARGDSNTSRSPIIHGTWASCTASTPIGCRGRSMRSTR